MVSSQQHLDIKAWLIVLDLQQYEGNKNTEFSFDFEKFLNFHFSNRKLFKVSWR